jgi:hypothetical protein
VRGLPRRRRTRSERPRAAAVPLGSRNRCRRNGSARVSPKAADRAKAADQLRPDLENRLQALSHTPLGIARAFSPLSGPGMISEAPNALGRH